MYQLGIDMVHVYDILYINMYMYVMLTYIAILLFYQYV